MTPAEPTLAELVREASRAAIEQGHRDYLLALAIHQIALPWKDVTRELADHSRITDPAARELAFDDLCRAVADGEDNRAGDIITLLRGAV